MLFNNELMDSLLFESSVKFPSKNSAIDESSTRTGEREETLCWRHCLCFLCMEKPVPKSCNFLFAFLYLFLQLLLLCLYELQALFLLFHNADFECYAMCACCFSCFYCALSNKIFRRRFTIGLSISDLRSVTTMRKRKKWQAATIRNPATMESIA